jgi:hypothetical protein
VLGVRGAALSVTMNPLAPAGWATVGKTCIVTFGRRAPLARCVHCSVMISGEPNAAVQGQFIDDEQR